MAGNDNRGINGGGLTVYGGLREYVGSDAWKRAFPNGVTRDTTNAPLPDNGHTGNPWQDPGSDD